jgi:hypothetical protein
LAPQTFALMFSLHAKSTKSSIMQKPTSFQQLKSDVIIILDQVFVTCGGIEFLELFAATY